MNRKRLLLLAMVLALGLTVLIAPSAFAQETVTVTLLDSHGNGIPGGQVKWADGGWHDAGTTGSDGTLTFDISNPSWGKILVTYHQAGWEKPKVQCIADSYTWRTVDAGIKLVDHTGAGLPGGVARQGGGYWDPIGITGADGTVPWEVFPGFTYKFDMSYNHTSETRTGVSVPGVVFQTGELTLHFSGSIRSNKGGSWWNFAKPSMEFLPGAIPLHFSGPGHPEKAASYDIVAGAAIEESAAYVRLLDSAGKGLAGGVAQYYDSGWKSVPGSTDSDGALLYGIPGSKGNLTFRMSYAGAAIQKAQNIGLDSFVVFQTTKVTMKLLDSGGAPLAADGQYYASGWKTFGTTQTTAAMELLPTTYTFAVKYAGAQVQKAQNVASDPLVVFNTVSVTMKLLDSGGAPLAADGQYYASGWKTFGTTQTTAAMELLPTTYTFAVKYAGAQVQKAQNVASDPLVVFNTVSVTMKLLDSGGAPLAADGQYYASGWKTFGTTQTTAAMELLPTTYTFAVKYAGAQVQKAQNVASDPLVVFNTVSVTMKLLDSGGAPLAADGQYYASGWKTFGTTQTTAAMELLPTTYTFAVKYAGAQVQKAQNVASDPLVVFNTVSVTMKLLDSGGAPLAADGQYYASGWKTFGTTQTTAAMELLPTTYTFAVSYGGGRVQKSQNVASDPLVVFTGTEVTIQFTGDIQYYASGWKTFAKPMTVLLPGTYTLRFSGSGHPAVDLILDVTGERMTKSAAYVRLISSANAGLAGGAASAYMSGWKDIGTTTSSGAVVGLFDGLLGSTSIRMNYAGAGQEKTQNLSADSFVAFQTAKVSMTLLDSTGATELNGGAQYYASGWKTFGTGTTTTSMELLPVSYTFAVNYGGAQVQKTQNVSGGNSDVVFNTVLVSMTLLDSTGATELNGGAQYYASGWKTFGTGTTTTSMELLPVSYTFAVNYGGAQVQKTQNVSGGNSDVVFNTVLVSMTLLDSTGATELNGGAQYYASGWKTFGSGTTTTSMELLATNYSFAVNFAGGRVETSRSVTNISDRSVVFRTGQVHSNSGTCTQYYASGWKTFIQDMELLPASYLFKYLAGPDKSVSISAGVVNAID